MRVSGWASPVKKQWRYQQSDPYQRRQFLRLRERYRRQGKTLIYLDESGFELSTQRQYAYAPRGCSVLGYRNGQKRPRTSLLAARLHKGLIAPLLFPSTCNAALFNLWLLA